MPKSHTNTGKSNLAYYVTVLLLILGSFFDESRVWGINAFFYLPLPVTTSLVVILVSAPFLTSRLKVFGIDRGLTSGDSQSRPLLVAAITVVAMILAGGVFYMLRAKTHFLGDGYSLLANLAKWVPYQKPTELGTDIVVQWVARAIHVSSFQLAEQAYQIVSIGSGTILVGAVVLIGRVFFTRRLDRVLFALLSLSGGQMLLFFGYVENYALLSASSALFVLVGIGVARGWCRRLLILIPLALAIFFHLLGLALLPAAAYLLLRDSSLGKRIGGLSTVSKWGILAGLAIIGAIGLLVSGDRALFFRLTIVPLVAGRFTVRGYTLLSPSHLFDFANLCFLLCPGILVSLAAVKRRTLRSLFNRPEIAFLGIVTLGTLIAAFLLDPKLGMARDWDLLSLAGFPLTVLAALVLLDRNDRAGRTGMLLAMLLGFAVLFSRAAVQYLPESGTKYAEDVMKLDLARSRNAFTSLIDYYAAIGDQGKSAEIRNYWQSVYPEVAALKQVSAMFASGQLAQGKEMLDAVVARAPEYPEAWAGLCIYYYRSDQYDSALVAARIANGLNPNNPAVLFNMGLAQYSLGNTREAEQLWLESVRIDSSFAALSLARLYRDRGDSSRYEAFLYSTASRPAARPEDLKEAIQLAIKRNKSDRAVQFFHRFRAIGIDSAWVDSMVLLYPQLESIK